MPASNPHEDFMHQALALARQAEAMDEGPVGALVGFDGEVIAEAHNLRERDQDPTAHAELIAMQMAAKKLGSWRLENCTVYVTLEPCAMCAGAMVLSRISACVFAASDPRGGFLGTLDDLSQHPVLNHRFEVTGGVLADESSELLKAFFRDKRKKRRKE